MASSLEPTPEDLVANHGPGIIAGNLTVAILATIAAVLRLAVRYVQKTKYGVDDFLILLALPFGLGSCICALIEVHYGLGRHIDTLRPQVLPPLLKTYFISELMWAISVPLIKISILFLYLRIFGRLRYLRNLAYGVGTFVVCWAIMVFFVLLFQCHPVQRVWHTTLEGTCIDSWLFFVIGSTLNVLTDFVILVLPLPAVWSLQLSRFQKVSLIGIFSLGSLTSFISLARLLNIITKKNDDDPTWSLGIVAIWSSAEPCLGIVAACLPTLRPLFTKIISPRPSLQAGSGGSSFGKKYGRVRDSFGGGSSGSRNDGDFLSKPYASKTGGNVETHVTAVDPGDGLAADHKRGRSIPLDAIEVETTWESHG